TATEGGRGHPACYEQSLGCDQRVFGSSECSRIVDCGPEIDGRDKERGSRRVQAPYPEREARSTDAAHSGVPHAEEATGRLLPDGLPDVRYVERSQLTETP